MTAVKAELEAGADVNGAKGSDFNSPLHLAIDFEADSAVVELMLEHGADPNASGHTPIWNHHGFFRNSHRTPLQLAVERHRGNSIAIIRLLLEYGADPNPPTDYDREDESPLFYASLVSYPADNDIIALLLEHGADVNSRGIGGRTPLHRAAFSGYPTTIDLLLSHGADIHAKTNADDSWFGARSATPLHIAANFNKHPESIALLLDRGAEVNARNIIGETLLHLAASNNHNTDVVLLLLSRGANVNAIDHSGQTPLHRATRHDRNPAVIPLLLANGADANAGNAYGDTPLHLAESYEVMASLLDYGADVNARNRDGGTPLHNAVTGRYPEIVALLLERGARTNARSYQTGITPLHWALMYNAPSATISLLVDNGADLSAHAHDLGTPCQFAKDFDLPKDIRQLVCP